MPGCLKYWSSEFRASLFLSQPLRGFCVLVLKGRILHCDFLQVYIYITSPVYKYKTERGRTHLKIESHTSVTSRFLAYANLENVISS